MGKIYEVKRGKSYIYYYRHSRRVKLDPAQGGKARFIRSIKLKG